MSITFSLLLLLALLGFSLHACDSRAFGAVVQTKENNGELNPGARVSSSTPSRLNHTSVEQDDDRMVDIQSNGDDLRSGAGESESVASVQWRVPHRKKGEAEPGFNSDYLPPKTHPPVHN